MKKIILLTAISMFFSGCNMNPNKEARIQKLETALQQTQHKIEDLETRLQTIEAENAQLKTRLLRLEEQ